jgi:hypothetical protein
MPQVRMPAGWLPSAVMVVLLVFAVAGSSVAADWVPGSQAITPTALVAALVMGAMAVIRRIPWPVALLAGLLATPFAAYVGSASLLAAAYPHDPSSIPALLQLWGTRLTDGEAVADEAFFLYILCALFWVVGGWLSWCVLRWRQPLLGLVPGAAAFATTLLNYPTDQNGYMLAFLVLTLSLLLWNHYQRSLADTRRRRVKVSSDATWDFWETGVVVTAAVVAFGIFAPPLTSVDRTVDIENGLFRNWAELQQRLNHPVAFGRGEAAGTSIGFDGNVKLGGPIHKTGGLVMTYTIEGAYNGPRYFRGVNDVRTANAEWRYDPSGQDNTNHITVAKGTVPAYAETYHTLGVGDFKMQMLKPPQGYEDLLFYPGELVSIDRTTIGRQVPGLGPPPNPSLFFTLDRLSGTGKAGGSGSYKVTVAYSLATEDQLRAASTDYGSWLDPYRNFAGLYRLPGAADAPAPLARGGAYRSPATLQKIHDLAVQVTAGKTTQYDQVQAIETYLRSNYTYTLAPPIPPAGADPIDYFLFTSKEGYCEYFATAMGDMVRSLGIPVRLVNGYGAGNYDDRIKAYVIRESDAHTWVESYFPGYGWIPFEPTPDGTYFPILRGPVSGSCVADAEFCSATDASDTGSTDTSGKVDKAGPAIDPGATGIGGVGRFSVSTLALSLAPWLAILLVIAATVFVLTSRWLRPTTAGAAWRRALFLARLAGLRRQPGETPFEYGARLGREAPELRSPANRFAEAFSATAYAPPELAARSRDRVLDAYAEIRPLLMHRIRDRNRFG